MNAPTGKSIYFLVGRYGDIYGATAFKEIGEHFLSIKPGRSMWEVDVKQLHGTPPVLVEGGMVAGQPTKIQSSPPPSTSSQHHCFMPEEDKCLWCPCKKDDPDSNGICDNAPHD